MSTETASAGASFYALGPEFEWLASAWDGFARELADVSSTLRHVVEAATADPQLVAESSGLAALESATDRLVRELVEDAAASGTPRRRTSRPTRRCTPPCRRALSGAGAHRPRFPGRGDPGVRRRDRDRASGDRRVGECGVVCRIAGGGRERRSPILRLPRCAAPDGSGLWHPDVAQDLSETALGTLSRVRRQIIARADHWVAQHVPYNQGAWHEGYRTDCSGYVSMCWGLRDSLVTSTMPQIAHRDRQRGSARGGRPAEHGRRHRPRHPLRPLGRLRAQLLCGLRAVSAGDAAPCDPVSVLRRVRRIRALPLQQRR